ncbi:MAG TPA: response regulator transcription factor [Anaerolineales bacterium]|jgi:two-component system KDP operon response regulator KdpE
MTAIKILLIGDEPNFLLTLRRNLFGRGYDVSIALDDQEAYVMTSSMSPDLVVLNLDFTIIKADGLEICTQIRKLSMAPIIVLSTIGAEKVKIDALDMGADDYLVMPFGMDEFLARVRASQRRWSMIKTGNVDENHLILSRGLLIDTETRRVILNGENVKLTPREYDILVYLAKHAGKVISHRELLKAVWGNVYGEEREYLRVFISQLRHKIETDPIRPEIIMTEPGIGYRFISEPS